MLCPFCEHAESKVVNSRQSPRGDSIRRRRECMECGHRFTTFETIEKVPIRIVKSDGRRQDFDPAKVMTGISRACEKRPISTDQMERVVVNVEKALANGMDREVPAARIGELVLTQLRELDQVAYVRFASVYRQFRDVADFDETLKSLHPTPISATSSHEEN